MAVRKVYLDEFGERRYAPEMIDWLSNKPQSVWIDVVPNLNWDAADPFFHWMATQPRCDLVVAAWIFWGTDIESVVKGGYFANWRQSGYGKLAVTIADNVRHGFYRSGDLGFPEPYRGDLARSIERWRAIPHELRKVDPDLDLPAALLGPFNGRARFVRPDWRAQHNPYVWGLFNGLATTIGRRPGWSNLFNVMRSIG
jgi:hypothetical protein